MGNSQRESWRAPSLKSRLGRSLSAAVCSCCSVSPDLSGSRAQADLGGGHTRPCQSAGAAPASPAPGQQTVGRAPLLSAGWRGPRSSECLSVLPRAAKRCLCVRPPVCAGIAVTGSPRAESCLALAAGGSGSEAAGRRRAPSSAAANFRQLTGQYFPKVGPRRRVFGGNHGTSCQQEFLKVLLSHDQMPSPLHSEANRCCQ